jgi:hypothetical protein
MLIFPLKDKIFSPDIHITLIKRLREGVGHSFGYLGSLFDFHQFKVPKKGSAPGQPPF